MILNHEFKNVEFVSDQVPFGIHYVDGNAVDPIQILNRDLSYLDHDPDKLDAPTRSYIVHCCNDIGGWGSGFVVAISKKWKEPEAAYREWAQGGDNFSLGNIQVVPVEDQISVVNIIGQKGVRKKEGDQPIRYDAIRIGFDTLVGALSKGYPIEKGISPVIHMPRIGCGLAGGSWAIMQKHIMDMFCERGYEVVVYDFPGGAFNP